MGPGQDEEWGGWDLEEYKPAKQAKPEPTYFKFDSVVYELKLDEYGKAIGAVPLAAESLNVLLDRHRRAAIACFNDNRHFDFKV